MFAVHHQQGGNVLISGTREKSAVADSAEPRPATFPEAPTFPWTPIFFLGAKFLASA
jgi:hypothetical protein